MLVSEKEKICEYLSAKGINPCSLTNRGCYLAMTDTIRTTVPDFEQLYNYFLSKNRIGVDGSLSAAEYSFFMDLMDKELIKIAQSKKRFKIVNVVRNVKNKVKRLRRN